MPGGRCGADAGHARGIGKGEAGRAFFRDQPQRRLQQRLFQIAVVVAALGAAFLAPTHVKGFYMSRAQRSLGRCYRRDLACNSVKPAAACCTSGEKSDISCTCRISMISFLEAGHLVAQAIASSRDLTSIIQEPPSTSLASVNEPSVPFTF